jgi:hypothetical protein
VDQRIIDDIVGHQTEQQRRRYRHLYPDVKQEAMLAVFADSTRRSRSAKASDRVARPPDCSTQTVDSLAVSP